MTMTQRFAGALRRHAHDLDVAGARPVQAEMIRQAARHMEEQQQAVDAVRSPWQPMRTAPKDGLAVLVLVEGSDIPRAARWLCGPGDRHATELTTGPGWHLTWDGTPVSEHDGPRYWMHCPADPDDGEQDDA